MNIRYASITLRNFKRIAFSKEGKNDKRKLQSFFFWVNFVM
jgi:hypothetical protein